MNFRGLLAATALLSAFILTGIAPANAETTSIRKTFDNWLVSCVKTADKPNRCTIMQSFNGQNAATKKQVFVLALVIGADGEDGERIVVRSPLGVDLTKDLSIEFPGTAEQLLRFGVCNRRGCFVDVDIDEVWLSSFANNQIAKIRYSVRNGQDINVEIDLKGFMDAYEFYKVSIASQ